MLVNASSETWNVVFANEAWETLVGHQRNLPGTQTPFWDIFEVGRVQLCLGIIPVCM